jgi:hypothetical protein
VGHFVDVYHHMGHNDTGKVLSRDVSTYRTFRSRTYRHILDTWGVFSRDVSTYRIFRSGTYRHIMFQAVGPYVAALLYANLIELSVVYTRTVNNKRSHSLLSILTLGNNDFNNLALPDR